VKENRSWWIKWQLEKLALVTTQKSLLFFTPGMPAESIRICGDPLSGLWDDAVAGPHFDLEARGARVAVIPEGSYVAGEGEGTGPG